MRFFRYLSLLSVLLVLLVGLVVAPAAAQGDNILHIVVLSEIHTLDPHIAYEFDTWPAASLFYRGLITLRDPDTPEPALAESFTASEDGTVYTFKLREGVKFSNGRDITPEDVKYSFERLLSPDLPSPTAYMFGTLVGAAEYQSGEADEVTGIRIVDDRTVEFTFTEPNWTMIKRFALPPAFIVAREGVEAAENFGRQPLGAGPFVLDSWDSGVRIQGSRNPYYWREGMPYVDGFEITIGVEQSVGILRMQSGEADISLDQVPNADYPQLASDPALADRLLSWAGFPNTDYVTLNTNVEPLNNIDVRRALDMAIDRDRLRQINNNRAIVANGMFPPSMSGDNKELLPTKYDPDGARELLAKAGYPDGFTLELTSSTDSQQQSMAQAIISDWAAIGVQTEYTPMDAAQFIDFLINQPDQIQAALTQWWNDYQDPSNSYEPLLMCGGSYNFGRYCNAELDKLFVAANALPTGDARWAAFSELEAKVQEALPNLYLYHMQTFYFRSERLQIESDPGFLLRFDEARVQ